MEGGEKRGSDEDKSAEGIAESRAFDQLERSPLLSCRDKRGGSEVNFLPSDLLFSAVFGFVDTEELLSLSSSLIGP